MIWDLQAALQLGISQDPQKDHKHFIWVNSPQPFFENLVFVAYPFLLISNDCKLYIIKIK